MLYRYVAWSLLLDRIWIYMIGFRGKKLECQNILNEKTQPCPFLFWPSDFAQRLLKSRILQTFHLYIHSVLFSLFSFIYFIEMLKYTPSRKDTIMNPYCFLVTIIILQVLFCLSLLFSLWNFLSKLILFQYTKMNCAHMPQISFFLLQDEKLYKSLNMILRKIYQWKYVIWKLPFSLSLHILTSCYTE